MKASELADITKIAGRITNSASLTPIYRSMELGPDFLRACSEFGVVEIATPPTGLEAPCLLDVASVSGVASSLPGDTEIKLTQKDNSIQWRCGKASGHWTLVQQDHQIPPIDHASFPWTPPSDFPAALKLASSACQAAAVSIGLFGIVLEIDGDTLRLTSTNSISLAVVRVPKGAFPISKVTLRPPVPGVLAAFLSACPNCTIDITADGIFVLGDWLMAQLPLSPQLERDLTNDIAKFASKNHVAKVNSSEVKKFLSRAKILTDRHATPSIRLKVAEGNLVLEHSSVAAAAEEFFLAEGLDKSISYESVSLPIDLLMVPLEHIETAVFDHLPNKALVLCGTSPDFQYIVGGN